MLRAVFGPFVSKMAAMSSYAQPYALAVIVGVNDLRPDPVVLEDYSINVEIPQLGDTISIQTTVQNFGNVEAKNVEISLRLKAVRYQVKQ